MLVSCKSDSEPIDILFVTKESWPDISSTLPATGRTFAEACGFEPKPGRLQILPGPEGGIGAVLFGLESETAPGRDLFLPGQLEADLPPHLYRFVNQPHDPALAALSWLLSAYRFGRNKTRTSERPRLCVPEGVDPARIERIAEAVNLGRDLINTPANEMDPDGLEVAALELAARSHAQAEVFRGEELLEKNLPLIFAVGRAAEKPPRLVDFRFGPESAPKVTLIGKGVCFDSGGLNIKSESAMGLMKKDMGGAATALALAALLMQAALPVRLRVLLPIVENAISAKAMRPGDIYPSRKGLRIEIGNTDAEGRLILADALALADEEAPDLLIDLATLTGAARVALGPDLPPFYTMDDTLAAEIARLGLAVADPVWRLPLWEPYDRLLDGKIADLNNVSGGSHAGSITAALFLRRFVALAKSWVHFDIFAWTPKARPGRPEGAEIQAARLLYELIEARYGTEAGQVSILTIPQESTVTV
ncbi:MAG: leucyl aminopeptidase family protein [Alphaproteobacteria bacterium]|nr:leucyl aminopeptidase family protein [Alphaproteobacteria bacterium]